MQVLNVTPDQAVAYIKLDSQNLSSVCVSLMPVLIDPQYKALVEELKLKADEVANYSPSVQNVG